MNREFYVPCAPYAYPGTGKNGGGSRGFLRLSKFLSRSRSNKQPEEISIGSSNAAAELVARSSLSSSESRNGSDSYQRVPKQVSSKLPSIGSHLRRLMKFKSQREIKSEEEVIIMPAITATDDADDLLPAIDAIDVTDQTRTTDNPETFENSSDAKICDNCEESITVVPAPVELATEVSAINETPQIENPQVLVAVLTAQLGVQAEAQIQVSRRHRDAPRLPFLYPGEEARLESYAQSFATRDNESLATGSESSGLSEVTDTADDDDDDEELQEGSDDAATQEYYNAVLRAVIRKQFRHLDDEPPIY